MRMSRESYTSGLPEEARLIEQEGGIAYHYEGHGKLYGMYFRGKAQKPTKHYSFRTEEQREAFSEKFFEEIQRGIEWKRKRKEEAAKSLEEAYGGLEVGAIFYSSWGYEQTNINFYQVVGIKGKNLTIQEIGKKTVSESQSTEMVVPAPEIKIGETFTKRLNKWGGLSFEYTSASPYTHGSRGVYQTAYGWGH